MSFNSTKKNIQDDFQINQIVFFSKDELYDILEYLIKVRINIKYPLITSISDLKISIHNGLFNGVRYTATIETIRKEENSSTAGVDAVDGGNEIKKLIPIKSIHYKQTSPIVREKIKIPFVVIEQKIGINKKTSFKNDDYNKLIPGIGLVPRNFKINSNSTTTDDIGK